MIKFAKSMYGSFECLTLGLKLANGDVFAVTPEIDASQIYHDGVATKNFIPVEVKNTYELTKVKNLNDAIRAAFNETLAPVIPTPIPEAEEPVEVTEVIPVQEETIPEPIPEPVEETEEIEDVPELSFTKQAGKVKNALRAIAQETDMAKLEFALATDERVSVQKALLDRIEELQ